jgi:hypothetical protein
MFADAAKDPVANFMNLNNDTVPLICTMVRTGIPFEDAAMLFSTKIVGDIIKTLNDNSTTDKFGSFTSMVERDINEMESTTFLDTSDKIMQEGLSREELVQAIKGKQTEEIRYKVLKALQTVIAMNDVAEAANAVTRLNSITSAVGPQIVDNVLFEEKLNIFTEYLYDSNGKQVELNDLLDKHPILKAFAQMYVGDGYYKQVFKDSAITEYAKSFLLKVGENFNVGKDLLDKYVEYALSDMLVSQGLIEYEGSKSKKWYEYEFPNEFFEKYKKQYMDNPFVQKIVRSMIDDTQNGKTVKISSLKIDYLNLDETERQVLKNGWRDLDKVNPELAEDLFKYWFLRGGLSFTPLTGMALLPLRLRQKYYGDNPSEVFSLKNVNSGDGPIIRFYLQNNNNPDLVRVLSKKTFKFERNENSSIDIYAMREPTAFAFKIQGQDNLVYIYNDKYFDEEIQSMRYVYDIYDVSKFDINKNFSNFADTFEKTKSFDFFVKEKPKVSMSQIMKDLEQRALQEAMDENVISEHTEIKTVEELAKASDEELKTKGFTEEQIDKIEKKTEEQQKKDTQC